MSVIKKISFIFIFMLSLVGSSESQTENLSFVCGENKNNSLSFSSSIKLDNPPKFMNFNKDKLIFCNREGNLLKYMKEKCESGNTTIRYDPIIKEVTLNDPPSQIRIMCK